MARGRLILRTLGSSRKFATARTLGGKLGEFCQTLYPLLVANTDDYGRQAGDAFTVKLVVFPSSPRREDEFEYALKALESAGLIVRYIANGQQVLQVLDFGKGQPNLHKRTASAFPEFSGEIPEIPSQLNITEFKRTQPNTTAHGADASGFEEFWTVYPKKKSRADAEKAWRKLAPSPGLRQRIKDAIAAQRVSPDWLKEDGKFIPYPASWLNGKRWEDSIWIDPPPVVEPEPVEDWYDECGRLHGHACNGRYAHGNRMVEDAIRARERAAS